MANKGMTVVAAGAAIMAMAAVAVIRSRRFDFRGTSVFITGGSRGLGLELARQLAVQGARLSLIARGKAELERARRELMASGADVLVFPCDLRNEEEIERAVTAVQGVRGGIDVLINNAGIIQVGPEENQQLEDYREAMAIHAWAPLLLMRKVVPIMKRQGRGRIVNISSIGGLVAVPHLLPYCMSKFALTGLSDGMRSELAKDNILVTTVAPGLMRTGSHVRAFFKGKHTSEFAWFSISGANPFLSTTPERTARRIIGACRYGKPRLIVTLPAMLLHGLNANFPDLTATAFSFANRLLPAPTHPGGDRLKPGWQCRSNIAPSLLTRLADRAVPRNNEAP
ncbi:SDR family NAD(P)-dependent oxidoreductase [Geotalea sp. SG265]|uniref:SDR family NAD(P)-dependent oxidoreductase n=1 Tax=Geotalea sp. SG265 TaxID=2922867 RepID=UPI001FB04785|nr:SDR family NAD(P)-dependent oxidoreductase [Geotalea sp. SG265]